MNPSYIFFFLTTIQHLSSYTSSVATQVKNKAKPILPTVLQWNARGLRTRLPDLRQHLLLNPVDVLAIQEQLTQPGDFRLSPYVIYSSAPALANGRSRALLLVKAGLLHSHVDLSAFSSHSAEYVAATIHVRGAEFTVVSVAPGPDGVTYQALRNIDECHYPNLLEALNHVWQTSEIPDAWKLSHVIPIPKSGKPLTSPESYRPISLTSCVGKLLERLVLRRLTWHLDATEALPEFTNEIGNPGPRFPIRPPHSTQPPLNVQRSLPDVRARKDLHPVVARTAVAVALEEKYASSLEIYTDDAHALPSPTYHLRPFHEARLLIARNIRSRHPDPSTARGTPPIPVPDSRLTRADASLALHCYGRAGRVDSPECTVCGDPEDITHILLICPEYNAGGQTATTTCLLFPTGSRRQAWRIFRAVLEFLHQTELAERLKRQLCCWRKTKKVHRCSTPEFTTTTEGSGDHCPGH
ncbi:hypothetical protein HPB47_012336 [Ixodes persulcatus]|uniref:Uncharacterized protein n=1 Tax=Ixodes persulcatus TaxID=34615 RepID=A0AC60NTS9_IXOPE|nr:hypothetical protein HPB47_012336 [Ixodes persulcatus]